MTRQSLSTVRAAARIGVLGVSVAGTTACGAGELLGSGRHNGALFLGTFLALAMAAFVIALARRKRQLERWDLGAEPSAPLALTAVHPLYWIAGGALLLFGVADLALVQHGGQKALNLLLFAAGVVIGGFLGGFLGLRLAERRWR